MGQQIVEAQETYGWGKSVVERLAKDLSDTFPNVTYGFSARNLWDMRHLYIEYRSYPILRQLVAEIPWGQNLVILQKVKEIKVWSITRSKNIPFKIGVGDVFFRTNIKFFTKPLPDVFQEK